MTQKQINLSSKYKPLFKVIADDNIRYVLMEGGRGSGKSVALSTFLNHLTFDAKNKILFTRYTMASAGTSIIPEFREKAEWLGNEDSFISTKSEVINKITNSEIIYRGLKPSSNTANSALKSANNVNILVLEEAQECADHDLFERVDLSIRTKHRKNLIVIVLNPIDKGHWIFKRFYDDRGNRRRTDTLYIKSSYLDNLNNLDDSFVNMAEEMKEANPRKYDNIFMGNWLSDVQGALWTFKMLDKAREPRRLGPYKRIVVAIDPAVSSKKTSDETGIIVSGIDTLDNLIVIDDISGRYTPNEWGNKALNAYYKYEADCMLGEVNNGGDLIESNIKNLDQNVKFKQVRATRGKILRAEPIAGLYESNKVYHVKRFPELDEQMTSYTGDGDVSPDRLDALVWSLTELSQRKSALTHCIVV